MLYRKTIAVCPQIHTKHKNTLCGQNVEFNFLTCWCIYYPLGFEWLNTILLQKSPRAQRWPGSLSVHSLHNTQHLLPPEERVNLSQHRSCNGKYWYSSTNQNLLCSIQMWMVSIIPHPLCPRITSLMYPKRGGGIVGLNYPEKR